MMLHPTQELEPPANPARFRASTLQPPKRGAKVIGVERKLRARAQGVGMGTKHFLILLAFGGIQSEAIQRKVGPIPR
jgi:hypothetical protein